VIDRFNLQWDFVSHLCIFDAISLTNRAKAERGIAEFFDEAFLCWVISFSIFLDLPLLLSFILLDVGLDLRLEELVFSGVDLDFLLD
jgi:hypothetical protein